MLQHLLSTSKCSLCRKNHFQGFVSWTLILRPTNEAKLLQSRASPNAPGRSSGLGMSPLSFLAITANSNPHALPIAQLLVAATADLNAQVRCGGIFRALELLSRAYLQIATPRAQIAKFRYVANQNSWPWPCLYQCAID